MAVYNEKRNRPGISHIVAVVRGAQTSGAAPGGGGGGGGGGTEAGSLTVSTDGVLIYSGQTPTMDGNTLVYTPTPTMADTVMTIS